MTRINICTNQLVAVLVNTTLFIMFGLAVYSSPLDDILVLSVNDVNNLYFPDTFPYIEQVKPVSSSNGTISAESAAGGSSSLSTGAVAGIAVACVVIVSDYYLNAFIAITAKYACMYTGLRCHCSSHFLLHSQEKSRQEKDG